MIPNPVICNNCRTALKSSYDFKSRCLFVEKKIQNYIESQNYNENHQINYDLSQIPSDDVPPLNKLALLIPKNDAAEQDEVSIHPEKFLKVSVIIIKNLYFFPDKYPSVVFNFYKDNLTTTKKQLYYS